VIFQTEKQLKEIGDKLPADKKATIETALGKLKDAHKAQDIAGIDAAMTEINSAFQAASQEMYNAQAQAGGAGAQGSPFTDSNNPFNGAGGPFDGSANPNAGNSKPNDGGVTDVDFEEVK
jgi:molecular chaperone DnaK